MDIVLGVSMTPATVRMVLVEGEMADGATVDHDVFDVSGTDGSATSGAAAQVVDAVLGTKESAEAGGHDLKAIGVTWSDHAEAAHLRDALAARDIDDVMLVSDGHAAASLAQAVGRAVGYDTTALLFIDRDAATLSVVQTDDGSVVKVLSSSLHSQDAMAVLADMAAAVDAQDNSPQGMFVVGSGVDVSSVKSHLEHLVSLPVHAPDEPQMALARGAALAAAAAPALEASTVGLAYSQDPDGTTAGSVYAGLAGAETQLAPAGGDGAYAADFASSTNLSAAANDDRKPFLLVGSAMASIFVVGVVALVISLAVSIRPTADQRPSPGESAIVPSTVAPAPPPPPTQQAQPVPAPPPPQAETIKAPVPVAAQQPAPQAPPRTVYVEAPPPAPQAPAPQAPAPAPPPAAPPPAPVPVAPAPVAPAPVPVYVPPVVAPPQYYPRPQNPWNPPWSPPRPRWSPPWQYEPEMPKLPKPQKPPKQKGPGSYPGSGSGGYPGSGSGRSPRIDDDRGGSGGNTGHGGGSICVLNICAG
ncbi:membrane protein [Mycolicibacterium flavescens]|nr:membrane protein [Mycolicibacterium flavescens]